MTYTTEIDGVRHVLADMGTACRYPEMVALQPPRFFPTMDHELTVIALCGLVLETTVTDTPITFATVPATCTACLVKLFPQRHIWGHAPMVPA